MNKHAAKFGIDTLEELQHFLAQAGKETSGFKNLVNENLDYSVKNILDTFGNRFSQTDPTKLDPDDYAHDSEKFGEYVYGGRNGNTQPGDGYLYRGRGAIQITGRTHYTNFSNYYKDNFDPSVDILSNPDLISSNLEIAIISGLWFFKTEVIDKLPPINGNTPVLDITNKVNRREDPKKKEERKKIFDEKVKPNAKCN